MNYTVGMKLKYVPDSLFEKPELTEVTKLRKKGSAALSNGLVANDVGVVEGTGRTPGGRVEKIEH